MRLNIYTVFKFRKLLALCRGRSCAVTMPAKSADRRGRSCAVTMPAKSADRRGRSCAGPQIMSQPLLKKYVEHFLRAGTRPAPAFGRPRLALDWYKTGPCNWQAWLGSNYYFMRFGAILCFSNFRHWQASTPIGVVLKRRGRLRACSQRLSRHFNTIAPLGAEAWQ